jgi:hypothetical protein
MVDCIAEYDNDFISSGREDPDNESSGKYMYNALVTEGHDARLLRFSPSSDGTIPGGHQNPKNYVYWQVGCWGLTDSCSSECETSFIACVNIEGAGSAANQVAGFSTCIDEDLFSGLSGCTSTCSPTMEMMKMSEVPTTIWNGDSFGSLPNPVPRPAESLCQAD